MRLRVVLATLVLAWTLGPASARAAFAEPASAARPSAAAEARATERKNTFFGVVGVAAVLFGAAGLWLVWRSRRRIVTSEITRASDPPPPPPPAKVVTVTTVSTSVAMVCPTCRSEHGPTAAFCSRDGNRLVPMREGAEPGPAGGICPICKQGFDPGIQACPVHDEELVPAPLVETPPDSDGASPKICPTCGAQYRNGSGFCGADGSALVTVN